MAVFKVVITETLKREVLIEAKSKVYAEDAAEILYHRGKIILDADDMYNDAEFEVDNDYKYDKTDTIEYKVDDNGEIIKCDD